MEDTSSQLRYEALARELSNRMTLSGVQKRQAFHAQPRSTDVLRHLQDGSRISKSKSTHTTPRSSPVRHSTVRKHRSTRDLTSASTLMPDQMQLYSEYDSYLDRPSSWHYPNQSLQADLFDVNSNWQPASNQVSAVSGNWNTPADGYFYDNTQLEDQYASYQFPVPLPQPWYSMPSNLDTSSPIQSPYDALDYRPQPDFHDHISTIPVVNVAVDPQIEEEAEGEVDDSFDSNKTELVGMGLYDRPSTQTQSSFLFSLDEPTMGKGLKLEEGFVPAEEDESVCSESQEPHEQPQSTDTSPTETVPELDFDTVDNDSLRWPSLDTDRNDPCVQQPQLYDGCYQPPDYTGVYTDTNGQPWNYDGLWAGGQVDEYGQTYGPPTGYYYTGY